MLLVPHPIARPPSQSISAMPDSQDKRPLRVLVLVLLLVLSVISSAHFTHHVNVPGVS